LVKLAKEPTSKATAGETTPEGAREFTIVLGELHDE
jgi:hypothetical protein